MKRKNVREKAVESLIIHSKYQKRRLIVFLVLVFALLSMSIGYSANFNTILRMIGYVTLDVEEQNIEIVSIKKSASTNGTDNGYSMDYVTDSEGNDTLVATFDFGFKRSGGSSTMSITYQVVIENKSFTTKTLTQVNSTSSFSEGSSTLSYTMSGANIGTTVISPGESITVLLTFTLGSNERNTQYTINEVFEFEFGSSSTQNSIQLTPILDTTSLVFDTYDSIEKLDISLYNHSDYDVTYYFSDNNSNFIFVDKEGNALESKTISANTYEELSIYLKISDEHLFVDNSEDIYIYLNTTGPLILTYDVGKVSAVVPSSGAQEILENETVYDDASIDFTSTTTSSGVYKNSTDGEITYFYRGNVTDNYVSFAGFTWRIIRIDKYGTRIILDSILDTTVAWASSNTTTNASLTEAIELLKYENSLVKPVVDSWYNTYLDSYSDVIKTSLFCEDMSNQSMTSSGSNNTTYYFGSYLRNGKDSAGYTPEFVCDEEYITSYNIGLISGDEVAFAGGIFNTSNKNYYLYNSKISSIWWTISSSYYDTSMKTVGTLIVNGSTGNFYDWQNGSTIANTNAIRPVITLDTDRISGGDGSASNPYTFS